MGVTVQATFAATLVDEWVRAGVRHAVVAPGSRSTPLALALASDDRLRLHVHHDERVAGFLALGIGLATGVPAVVLTTSGTAAVELHPAVVEASQAGVPMLVCTADRPPELQSVGAPQTIDQTHLYGRAVRWFAEPGVADAAGSPQWRSLASRAVAEATGLHPGPVHLNLAFREPLVGEPGGLPPGRPDEVPWHEVVSLATSPTDGSTIGASLSTAGLPPAGRGLIVAGAGVTDPEAVLTLADRTGWPVLADPRSGCRRPDRHTVAAFDALLRHQLFADAHQPDVVVRLGAPPASGVLARWLEACEAHQVAVAGPGRWHDPEHTASTVVVADPSSWCRSVAERWTTAPDESWLDAWSTAEQSAQRAIDAVLAEHDELTEPGIAREVVARLAPGASLVVSSSMPVRDVEWYAAPRADVHVLANRGANGIDGVVSTAVGVALGGDEPVSVLVGDVAFLHDANALLGLADRGVDLTVVVVDNRGGGIFSFLPQAAAVPVARFEQLFGTPHTVDLAALVVAHGLPALTVHAADGLAPALAVAATAPGPHVVVAGTERAANVDVHAELHDAVAAALAAS